MTGPERRKQAAPTLEAVQAGDPLALARAITKIENGTVAGVTMGLQALDLGLHVPSIGVTGPPGAGKSSLVNALVSELLPHYPRIGVLNVDPSSPISGGAVLGDRIRMAAHSGNPDVFIRSLAARGHLGGVTRATEAVMALLAAAHMDLVIVETVGTGQSEVEVARLAQVKLVVCAPGMGDEMQAIKAGVLEVADLLVVNKADLPDADRTMNFLKSMLMHRGDAERRSALKVSATRREGVPELAYAIHTRLTRFGQESVASVSDAPDVYAMLARDVAELVSATLREASDPPIGALAQSLIRGEIGRGDAAREAIGLIAQQSVRTADQRRMS